MDKFTDFDKHLFENLIYDPDLGKLFWTKQSLRSNRDLGKPVGSKHSAGYLEFRVGVLGKKKAYLVHRVCWFLHHGSWPQNDIDHIDGNRLNNKIDNLRVCTRAENCRNSVSKVGSSIYKGVQWDKVRKKWQANIVFNNKRVFLGRYDTELEAAKVYNKAALEYFGEFARINVLKT